MLDRQERRSRKHIGCGGPAARRPGRMVDGITITLDVVETSVYFVAPGLLWLFVFLLAYCDDELARGSGFGRITFWLLLPAALLGEFANVLIFGLRSDLLAVNVGGGLV